MQLPHRFPPASTDNNSHAGLADRGVVGGWHKFLRGCFSSVTLGLLLTALVLPAALHAQSPGTLDTTFADPNFNGGPGDLALDANGKILAIGAFTTAGSANSTYGHLARFNADGTLDTSFANPNLSAGGTFQASVVPLSTGKILVAANFSTAGASGATYTKLARFNADGTLDTTFPNINATGTIFRAKVDANGKILIAGSFSAIGGNAAYARIARLNSDGSVDSTFTPPTLDVSCMDVTVVSSGKIYIAGGFSLVNGTARHFLARLNSNGSLDTTFQDPNLVFSGGNARSVIEDANGKVWVGGLFSTAGTANLARGNLARFNSDGTLDTTFGDPMLDNNVTRMVMDANGKLIVSGAFTIAGPSSLSYLSLARINTDGTVDTAFANPKLVDATGVSAGIAAGLALDSSGRILVAGNFVRAGSASSIYNHMARFYNGAPVSPPTVTIISPTSGTTAGGTAVTITGANLTGATGVTIGGTAATSVVVVSATSITCVTPAGAAGTASVLVTTPGGTNGANTLYTYVTPPTVATAAATSATPTGAVLNGTVNANGASTIASFNYGPTNTYGFSIAAAQSPVTGSSATPVSAALSGLVPGATYHYQAVGVNSGGTVLGADQTFIVLAGVDYDFETISSATISFSSSGKTWGLSGQFTGVSLGNTGAPAAGTRTPESGAYIDTGYGRAMSLGNVGGIQAPPGYTFRAASFDILPSDSAGNNGQYTIGNTTQANAVLTGVGATYQVIGKKGGTQVCSATVADTARTPADSDTSNQGGFWHHIDLTGTAFATTDIDDIEFVLIAQSNVSDPVTYIALDNFTYSSLTALPPTITGINITSGSTAGGTAVVITGTNLSAATGVKFGATAATGLTANTATSITATAPAGTGTVDITVTTAGGTSATSAADQFTYVAAPTVASLSSTKANGSYNATILVPITVTFSAPVTVTGTPTLALNSGGSASYASGSGTSTLTFNYTVGATDNTTGVLDCTSTSALALAGGTINATTGGTAASLTLPTPGGANSLGVNKAIIIDTTAPTITSIVRLTPSGQTTASNTVTFRVTYSEPVTVPGASNFAVVAVNGSSIVGTVNGVTGTGTTRDVTVSITSGTGEFRLRGVN